MALISNAVTVTTTPTRVTSAPEDSVISQSVLIAPRNGTVAVVNDESDTGYDDRLKVGKQGDVPYITFQLDSDAEDVWLRTTSGTVVVAVLEQGL